MSFDLVRLGWPNMAAILALALLPILTLAASVARQDPPAQQIDGEAPIPAASFAYIFG